jgi:hypothetical protein
MSYLAAHPTRVLACLVVMACGARAEEATTATPTADQSKVTVGAMLMSDYIYRGISPKYAPPGAGKRHAACFF